MSLDYADSHAYTYTWSAAPTAQAAAAVANLFESHQVLPWTQEPWRHAMDYALRVALSETPEDRAIIGAVGKFGSTTATPRADWCVRISIRSSTR